MSIPLALQNEKFANCQESIKILYLVDDNFRCMCDDYNITKENVEFFKQKTEEDFQCRMEYETLSIELEEEILRYIAERTDQ
ncbi:hypothetical protein DBB36_22405 [Flavobacterium sp. WLB]|uniref:Uncharacterized protein n=1 Tax=Flavobacterium panici TaxID=2654843 RepID=A0A9N8J4P0_9FLAO|nr:MULTISPECIES: hypothetical protein [Flavobacterium]KOP38785.1 hypothetical protein AKO67_07005 [Flavobacterium sp. VMW]OWU92720.1 hypothetical protein APR43_01270 [Flavobacterium sp. NLM]PUU67735.1 hypothetical protein DBB36_22405 [Flavobacterium sp. WLB]CAC9976130.1 hypothetical protein FLAPXU55_03854 [Flavobacterium panici]